VRPPLAALLEKAAARDKPARDIPESRDLPEVPHGKKYVERGTVVRLRKSGMLQLSKMLEQIEQQRVAGDGLASQTSAGAAVSANSYDVELGLGGVRSERTPRPPAPAGSTK